MRTDDLIAMLSTNVEPVDRRKLARTFGAALAIGGVAAIGVALLGFGLRTDLTNAHALVSLLLKVTFTVVVLGVAVTGLGGVGQARGNGVDANAVLRQGQRHGAGQPDHAGLGG